MLLAHFGTHKFIEHPFIELFCCILFRPPAAAPYEQRPYPECDSKAGERIFHTQCAKESKGRNEAGEDEIDGRFHNIFNT
jgi:hypothetical protein